MMLDAANARDVVERLGELSNMLDHGQVDRAKEFARELFREASAHVCGNRFDEDELDFDDDD